MNNYFGDPVDDAGPWKYLKKRGFTEYKSVIHRPDWNYKCNQKELDCIDFLIQEWDWGYEGDIS